MDEQQSTAPAAEDELVLPADGTETQTADVEASAPVVKPPVDERTSAFKELREHNKRIEKVMREQGEMIRSLTRKPEPQETDLVKPTLAQFQGDMAKWETAMEAWAETKHALKVRKAGQEAETKRAQDTIHRETEDAGFSGKLGLAKKTNLPDLDVVLEKIRTEKIGEGIDDRIASGMRTSPVAAEMFHYLGSNPDFTKEIESLPPHQQYAKLRALEGWLTRTQYRSNVPEPAASEETDGEPKLDVPPRNVAPQAPPKPKGGGSSVTHSATLATAKTPEEYLAAVREQKRKR